MRGKFSGILTILLLAAFCLAVPNQIAFQGRLNTDIGTPLEGTLPVIFSLFDVETGGTATWTETQSVEFRSGLFIVQLGSVVPIPDATFTGGTFYIEMTVDGELITPRKPLTSVPYAFSALNADNPDEDWYIEGDDMRNLNPGNIVIGALTASSTNRLEVHGNGEAGERAVVAISSTGPEGWLGTSLYGAYGQFDSNNYGALGSSGIGIIAHGETQAAQLEGDVTVTGDLTLEGIVNVSATGKIIVDGDAGGDDVLMADASGNLYWADGTGMGGDNWGTQVAQVSARLAGDGTVTLPLDIAQMGASDGDVLTWSGTALAWQPGHAASDDWGTQVVEVNPRLTGDGTATLPLDIATMGATSGQALIYDGTNWAPGDVATGGDDWGTQVVESDATLTGDGTSSSPLGLSDFGASTGQILKFDGSDWAPAADETGAGGDNWGSQVVQSSSRFTGEGTSGSPLELASMGATSGQVLAWDGTNWAPAAGASSENHVVSASFGTGDGVLTLGRAIDGDVTVDLDGRYLEAGADNAWTDAGTYIYPNAAPSFHIEDDGDLDLGGHDLESVDEISANTIDPVMKINGKLFRTWTTDQVGQKTVVEGVFKLDDHGYFEVDLSQQSEGSNLWLFYNCVVEESIIPFVTPHSPDHLYARVQGSKLIVGSTDQHGGTSFSYRLSGIRKDFRDMTEEETNIRTKDTDIYIDIDGGDHYLDKH